MLQANDRIATALVYLSDDFIGGETIFPAHNLTIRPQQGTALLFVHVDEEGFCNPTSTHLVPHALF